MSDRSDKFEPAEGQGLFSAGLRSGLLPALMDVRFQTTVTIRMLPAIYLVLIIGLVALSFSVVVEAFGRNLWQGIFHLLVIAPAYLVAGVVIIRISLELLMAIFRIAEHVEDLSGWSRDILGLDGLRDALRGLVPTGRSSD